jgi:hypothetical protein
MPKTDDKTPPAAAPFLRFQLVRRDDPSTPDGPPVSLSIYERLFIDIGQQASAQIEEKFLLHTLAFLQNAPRATVNTIADVEETPRVPWPQYLPESIQDLLALHSAASPVIVTSPSATSATTSHTEGKTLSSTSTSAIGSINEIKFERKSIPLIGPVRPTLSSGLQLEAQNMNRYDEQLQRPHYLYFKRFDVNSVTNPFSIFAPLQGIVFV